MINPQYKGGDIVEELTTYQIIWGSRILWEGAADGVHISNSERQHNGITWLMLHRTNGVITVAIEEIPPVIIMTHYRTLWLGHTKPTSPDWLLWKFKPKGAM